MQSYRLGKTQFWIVTLAPEAILRLTLGACCHLHTRRTDPDASVGYAVRRQQAKRIVQPLEDLAKAFARIGQLDFQSEPPASSEIEEVRQLSFAYEAMRDMLQKNQQQIAMQKQGVAAKSKRYKLPKRRSKKVKPTTRFSSLTRLLR